MTQALLRNETAATRSVESVHRAPGLHWVGDGFRVHGYFSAIPDAARRLSPFLMLDYHPPFDYAPTNKPRGVGVHPHRGFETVTVAFDGAVAHHDSTGAGGVIRAGDVQWMTAASGILHKEYHEEEFARRGGTFQMAQLWVNLPRAHKMDAPRYQPITAAQIGETELPDGAGTVRVIAGEQAGKRGPAKTFSPVELYEARLVAGKRWMLSLPSTHNVAVLVMKGDVTLGDRTLARGDFAILAHDGESIVVDAKTDAQLLVMGGEPIDEPVVAYGPFVMNSAREIQQAMVDFQNGKFGTLA